MAQVQQGLEGREAREVEDREEEHEEEEAEDQEQDEVTADEAQRTRREPVNRKRIGGGRDHLTAVGRGNTGPLARGEHQRTSTDC